MAKSVDHPLWLATKETFDDLASYPGRFAASWRMAAVCALVSGFAMMFNIPESALSTYLVIYLMKADGAENTVVAIAAAIAIALLIAAMIPIIQMTVESASIRLLVMALVSFLFIYLGAISKLGEGGSIVALIIAFVLSLVSQVPVNGIIGTALRYTGEMAILPMICIAGFSLFFGRWSVTLLREELKERLKIAGNALMDENPSKNMELRKKLEEGNDDQNKRVMLSTLLHQAAAAKIMQMKRDVVASSQLLFAISTLKADTLPIARQQYRQQVDDMIHALNTKSALPAPTVESPSSDGLSKRIPQAIEQAFGNLAGTLKSAYGKSDGEKFFFSDATTNPEYQRFALKTTLAAMVCYIFYNVIDWQGIHTAMVTCYVASMGTAGDTIHKLLLRICGCLIGAAIGIASILWLLPHMQSVSALMVLVFLVALVAGWVTNGSEKISYGGVQIGLAFTLTVLQGFGPTTDMDSARDRIIGILVGNFAVYLVSTLIWPTPVKTTIRNKLADIFSNVADIARTPPDKRLDAVNHVVDMEKNLGTLHYCFYLLPFEPKNLRPKPAQVVTYRIIAKQLSELGRAVYFSPNKLDDIAQRLNVLEQSLLQEDAVVHSLLDSDEQQLDYHVEDKQPLEERINGLELLVTGKGIDKKHDA